MNILHKYIHAHIPAVCNSCGTPPPPLTQITDDGDELSVSPLPPNMEEPLSNGRSQSFTTDFLWMHKFCTT